MQCIAPRNICFLTMQFTGFHLKVLTHHVQKYKSHHAYMLIIPYGTSVTPEQLAHSRCLVKGNNEIFENFTAGSVAPDKTVPSALFMLINSTEIAISLTD